MLGRHATWNAAWHAPRYDAATSRLPYATRLPRTDVFGDSSKHCTKLTGVGVFRTTIWDATLKGQKRNRGASVSLCGGWMMLRVLVSVCIMCSGVGAVNKLSQSDSTGQKREEERQRQVRPSVGSTPCTKLTFSSRTARKKKRRERNSSSSSSGPSRFCGPLQRSQVKPAASKAS